MTVRFFSITGIALALMAGWALRALGPDRRPENMASLPAGENDQAALAKATDASARAVLEDSANAYRWAALGEALAAAGRIEQARAAFRRATDLAPDVPQIWFHDAVFHFKAGETTLGLRSVRRIFDQVGDYDQVFFDYFDRLQLEPDRVLAELQQNRRAADSYTEHLIAINNVEGAQQAWHMLAARRFTDERLTTSYISCLLQNHRYEAARQDWAASRGPSDYPERNLIYNGDLERDFTACPLDWVIKPSKNFETTRDDSVAYQGRWSLKIRFHGDDNVSYANIVQVVRVHPGRHEFRAWIRTERITTDEGIRLQIQDPEKPARLSVETSPVIGTHDWMPIDTSFTVPESSNLIAVRVIRLTSLKFDSDISGTAWLDSFSLRHGS